MAEQNSNTHAQLIPMDFHGEEIGDVLTDAWGRLLRRDQPPPSQRDNATALAWLQAWYATPDTQPPGTWDALEALLEDCRCHICL